MSKLQGILGKTKRFEELGEASQEELYRWLKVFPYEGSSKNKGDFNFAEEVFLTFQLALEKGFNEFQVDVSSTPDLEPEERNPFRRGYDEFDYERAIKTVLYSIETYASHPAKSNLIDVYKKFSGLGDFMRKAFKSEDLYHVRRYVLDNVYKSTGTFDKNDKFGYSGEFTYRQAIKVFKFIKEVTFGKGDGWELLNSNLI